MNSSLKFLILILKYMALLCSSNVALFNFRPLVIAADFLSVAALISVFPLLVPESLTLNWSFEHNPSLSLANKSPTSV